MLICLPGFGQVRITGTIIGTKNQPVPGVSIVLKDTYDGATSDSAGRYQIETLETGDHVLEISSTGYNTYQKSIIIGTDPIHLDLQLKEAITELKAVVLTAGAFEASDQKKGTVLNALDIVTTASAQGDVTGAIKTLPGAQQVGESEGLFIRGGTATESKIYIDGTVVDNFFYSSVPGIASRGRFNPFLFKGTIFSSGGYSALYGEALSSALILESKDLPERTEANVSVSVIGVSAGIQKLAKNKRASWGITYNYTNLWPAFKAIPQKQDFYNPPLYHNGDINFRVKTKHGFIKYFGYGNWSRVGLRSPDIDSVNLNAAYDLKNINTYNNINWKESLTDKWKLFAAFSLSNNKDDVNSELQDENGKKTIITNPEFYAYKNFSLITSAFHTQGKIIIERKLNGLNLVKLGVDHFYSRESGTYTLYTGQKYTEKMSDNLSAAFAEADIYLTNKLAVKAGARTEYSTILDKVNFAPRVSVAYKMTNYSQLSFAYGMFYQKPESKYLPALTDQLTYAKATHYILQFQRINQKRSFRAEAFWKDYSNLYKTDYNNNRKQVAVNNNGKGYAGGLEIFWRDKTSIKNLDYWISYSYLDTKRDFLNFPGSIRPSFATANTASLVAKKFILKWKTGFNLSYTYATGRPYYKIQYVAPHQFQITDEGKTIPYNNLGFSVNYLPHLGNSKSKSFIVWVLSISNVLGQNQVYSYNYATTSNRKVEVTPPSKRFVYIGCFISFGIDRTEDAINNNL